MFIAIRCSSFKIIASSTKPIKAYQILGQLGKLINNPKPPTAYRAITFWHKHNFIHRIESLNAYAVCSAKHFHQGAQFMICNECGKVIESHIHELPKSFLKNTENEMFTPQKWNVEISGVCNECS